MRQIKVSNSFKKSAKKLMRNQIQILEDAIEEIKKNPEIGEPKKGDLAGVRVYKFHIHKQLMLLAYHSSQEIVLLSLNSHENFYRDLKKRI